MYDERNEALPEAIMQANLETIEKEVSMAARRSAVSSHLSKIIVEPDQEEDGTTILRVVVEVKDGDTASDADFALLLETIEDVVGNIDERYASVRFVDAA